MKYLLLLVSAGLINASSDDQSRKKSDLYKKSGIVDFSEFALDTPEKCISNKDGWFLKAGVPEEYVAKTYDKRLRDAIDKAQALNGGKPLTGDGYKMYKEVNKDGIIKFEKNDQQLFIYSGSWLSAINENKFVHGLWNKVIRLVQNKACLSERGLAWAAYLGAIGAIMAVKEEKDFKGKDGKSLQVRASITQLLLDNQQFQFSSPEKAKSFGGAITVIGDLYQQQYATDPEVFKNFMKKYLPKDSSEKK